MRRRARLTPGRAVVALAAVALLLYPVVSDNLYYQNMIILSLVFAIGAVGLNVISGYGGYVSLGQGAFLGLGAYTLAILSTRGRRLGLDLGAGGRASWRACSRRCSA